MNAAAAAGPHSALRTLDEFGRAMPGVWARYESCRDAYRVQQDWPTWCYAPTAVAFPITGERPALAAKLTALAAWRMTKGIYRFDRTLYAALMATPLDAAVPVDVLRRLPGWCIYVELDALPTFRGPACGAWVWLEQAGQTDPGPLYLSILLDTERDAGSTLDERQMLGLNVKLSGDSLLESLRQTYEGAAEFHDLLFELVAPVVSLLLYIGSLGRDMTRNGAPGVPELPVATRTRRKGSRLFPADRPDVWDLGLRMGAALRDALARDARDAGAASPGGNVAPHIRGSHWHTFLSGPRKNVPLERRQRDVRWMPPIAVNVKDLDSMPATVRRVL